MRNKLEFMESRKKFLKYVIGCCAVMLCAASVFGQNPLSFSSDGINMKGVRWANGPVPATIPTQYVIDFSVDGGVGFTTSAHQKENPRVESVADDTDGATYCSNLQSRIDMMDQSGLYKEENDSGRYYIEHCAQQNGSFHVFVSLDGAMQFMSNDNDRWLEYRTWLKKVLYLSLDSAYYCADASSIIHTFAYLLPDPAHSRDYKGEIAVIDYLLQNNRCTDAQANLLKGRKYLRDEQVRIWRDTVGKDSIHKPIDTSSVTLESMNLQILRGPQFAVSPSPSSNKANAILSFIATKNPFTEATSLRYELNDASALRLEIYDVLGREVYSEGEGMKEAGGHQIQLDGKLFSSGTYYARLTTLGGEVKTIALKHF